MKLGSLFSGSGGFELAGTFYGIEPVWASEIEPFPILVTTKRFPNMKHYGDVSKIDGAKVEPVDIVTFGSPCQDLSIAGKRAGLEDGLRSNLFYQAVRIIKEMRKATNNQYPRWAVWENVPGAFTSNNGNDFRSVLETLVGVKENVSIPKPNQWNTSGSILGRDYSLAWRVLDAQYWGVAQRRRRIFLVCDFDGSCASKVLFESDGLSRYSAESVRSFQKASRTSQDGIDPSVQGGGQYYDSHPSDSRVTGPETVASTVCSKYGTGGGNTPLVQEPKVFGFSPKSSNAMKSSNPDSGCYQADSVRTLDHRGGDPNCDQGGMAIVETVDVRLSSDGTINRRSHIYETARVRCLDTGGQNPDSNHGGVAIVHAVDMGAGKSVCDVLEEKSPTLSTTHYGAPAVNTVEEPAYSMKLGMMLRFDNKPSKDVSVSLDT